MKIILLTMLSYSLLIGLAFADSSNLKRITTVKVDGAGTNFKLLVGFEDGTLETVRKPLLGGNYVQFSFPNTLVKPKRQVFRIGGKMVKRVLLYQYDDTTTRLRVFMDRKKLNRKYYKDIAVTRFSDNILSIKYAPGERNSLIASPVKKIDSSGNILDAIMNQAKRAKSKKRDKLGEESLEDYFARKDKEKKSSKKASKTTSAFAKMLYSLGIVILLVFAVAWVFKKFSNGSKIATKSKMVEILSREYIGAKSYVAVAKVLDRYLLLGITNENISTLAELDEIPQGLVSETKASVTRMTFPKFALPKFKKKAKKQKVPAAGIFKKVLGDVSNQAKPINDVAPVQNTQETDGHVSFDSMQRIGEETLQRRAMGLEKKGDINEADEFARNFANMIKDKVKDLPEI